MSPDRAALFTATGFFLAGFGYTVRSLSKGKPTATWPAFLLLLAGFSCQCAFLLWRGRDLGRCPITTPFELLTFVSWAMVLLYFLFSYFFFIIYSLSICFIKFIIIST